MIADSLAEEYRALTEDWGLIDLSSRTRIELSGGDRVRFLNGFCSNDVQRLAVGQGCEAFVTNVKGKTIGHVFIFCGPEHLIIETVAGQAELLLTHLDRYLIRDDVRMLDRTLDWGQLLVAGPRAGQALDHWLGTERDQPMRLADRSSRYPIELGGIDARLIFLPRQEVDQRIDQLRSQGAALCSQQAWEILRIEAGRPEFGKDVTDANLPQEVNRDTTAISFTKGCYLGQETVARLDALGHVNRLLVSVQWMGQTVPAVGESIEVEGQSNGKPVGTVTSAIWSPRWDGPLGLAYLRVPHHRLGTKLKSDAGSCVVVDCDDPDNSNASR